MKRYSITSSSFTWNEPQALAGITARVAVPDARDMAFLPEFGYLTLANASQEWADARKI